MRLLFLARDLPLPPNNGTRLRTWALLRALAAEGHDVTLLAFVRPSDVTSPELPELRRICREVHLVPLATDSLTASANLAGRLRALPRTRPFSVGRFVVPEMRRLASGILEGGRVDAVLCDVFTIANITGANVPILLNHENVEHTILRRYCDVERNPAKRLYAWLEYRKMRRWEQAACARASVSLPCSREDARILSGLSPATPMVVAPNVVDMDGAAPAMPEEPATILFQGGMDWFPNRDAVAFFAASILPRVRERAPSATFVVAGRNPAPAFVASFGHVAGMSFTGTVPDMRAVIARATVSVAPLRIGSGTRLKIIEAAALGKAVVATSIGAEGLEFVDGKEILLADDPDRFAAHVTRLLDDPEHRRLIGTAARRRAEEHYGLPALRRALGSALLRREPEASPAPGVVRSRITR
jgi:glycosyltransferase involved in cell wall biosynthesis